MSRPNSIYRRYLFSEKWKQKRQLVFDRARKNANTDNKFGICERCGYKPWKKCLQVHHLTYEHLFDEPLEDLILLCPKCHKELTEEAKSSKNALHHKKGVKK